MIYPIEILNLLKKNQPEKILKNQLFKFRENADNDNYIFLIGICMLKMGYIKEAYISFKRASIINKKSIKNRLFVAISLLQANKYDECKNYILENINIDIDKLTDSEYIVLMQIYEKLNLNNDKILNLFLSNKNKKELRSMTQYFLIGLAYYLNNNKNKAYKFFSNLTFDKFKDLEQFETIMTELKIINTPISIIKKCFNSIPLNYLNQNNLLIYLRIYMNNNLFINDSEIDIQRFLKNINFSISNDKIKAYFYSSLYSYFDEKKDILNKEKQIKHLLSLNYIDELAYLTIVTDELNNIRNNKKCDFKKIKADIEKLLSFDSNNMLYRKLYFDFLMITGFTKEAMIINKASVQLKMNKEKEIFDLLSKFYQYFEGNKECPLCHNNENEREKCPLCFGSGLMPIIKTISFNTTPREIFAKKIISNKIKIQKGKKIIKNILNWQKMNIGSPLIGEYFQKNVGTYPSKFSFPDVLTKGETYIYISLTSEAWNKLYEKGYSLNQIDPLINILFKIQKTKIKRNFSKTDKEIININDLSESDFVFEIIKCIE